MKRTGEFVGRGFLKRYWYFDQVSGEGVGFGIENIVFKLLSWFCGFSDCFDVDVIGEIKSLISQPKKTLLLCDGGDKETEFKLFSRYLKTGDVVMLHDYEETPEDYEKIKTELDWPTISESHYKNLELYLPVLNLRPYLYEEFKQVLWGSFIKC